MPERLATEENKALRFILRFSRTLSCEMQVPIKPPSPAENVLARLLLERRSPETQAPRSLSPVVSVDDPDPSEQLETTNRIQSVHRPESDGVVVFRARKASQAREKINVGVPCP
jgi:hypothetical protein